MNIHELTEAWRAIKAQADDDVDDGAWLEALRQLEEELTEKVTHMAYLLREWEAEEGVVQREIDRLTKRRDALRNRQERLTHLIEDSMDKSDLRRVQTPTLLIRLQKSPPSVSVINEALVPSTFKRATLKLWADEVPEGFEDKAQYEVDRRMVLNCYREEGAEVQGTRIMQGMHLRIV